MPDAISVLAGLTAADVSLDPFAHIARTGCLDADAFATLSATMPVPRFGPGLPQNFLAQLDPFAPAVRDRLTPPWRQFADYHVSSEFWGDIVRVFGAAIRRAHPRIEDHLGLALEDATAVERSRPEAAEATIQLGFQLSYNTPVTASSTVRGPHLDKTRRLLSALLYMPEKGDDDGGNLEIYRWTGDRRLSGVNADPNALETVDRVIYAPNTLMMFVNSVDAVHGVTPRRPTGRIRRYVNLFADLAGEILDISPYQTGLSTTRPAAAPSDTRPAS